MSARVPAWKRLGLKLKGPASDEGTASSGGPNAASKPSAPRPSAHQTNVNGSPASALKRKQPTPAAWTNNPSAHTPHKKPRREEQGTPSSLRKSVSFADGTKDAAKTAEAKKKKKEKKEKKKKVKKASETATPDFNPEPSLKYLRQWHTARESWKFNKNHQTLLIKYFFDGDKIPSSDTGIFYEYIRDLKGFVRTRLRETAAEIKQKDMAEGAGAFPAKLKDKEDKQKQYEETIARFLQQLQEVQKQENGGSVNANGKRSLDEVEYVLRTTTPEVKQRLLKRIRAEMVLNELSDDESTTSTATATTTTTTSSASAPEPAVSNSRQSDGSQQPAKRRRLRNVRTDIGDDDSSSSDSDSESESDSSSSSNESEDEEMDMAPDANRAESSSSSSSSSSSESETEAADDSDEESESSSSSSEDSEDD